MATIFCIDYVPDTVIYIIIYLIHKELCKGWGNWDTGIIKWLS